MNGGFKSGSSGCVYRAAMIRSVIATKDGKMKNTGTMAMRQDYFLALALSGSLYAVLVLATALILVH